MAFLVEPAQGLAGVLGWKAVSPCERAKRWRIMGRTEADEWLC